MYDQVLYNINLDPNLIEDREVKQVITVGKKTKEDWHLVKEKIYLKDGTTVKRLSLLENLKKPVYITKPQFQNHKEKRERTTFDKVDKFLVTRTDQLWVIKRALGMSYFSGDPREVYKSPYLYNTDIEHSSYLMAMLRKKYPKMTFYDVAVFDIETNMFSDRQETIIASLTFKDKAVTVITEEYAKTIQGDIKQQLRQKFDEYLKDMRIGHPPKPGKEDTRPTVGSRNINWEIYIEPSAGAAIKRVFDKAHEWSPDFIAIWNIDFDLPKIVKDLEHDGFDPAVVFSDPFIPDHLKSFEYQQGPSVKVKTNGDVMPLKPAQRWHVADNPASFRFIDAMQVYYNIRIAAQDEPSYALDAILSKELGVRKLKFQAADHVSHDGEQWHKFVSKNYPLEYIIYNLFDCISIECLDETTYDIAVAMPSACGITPYQKYTSNPRKLWDKLQIYFLDRGWIGGNSHGIERPIDKELIGTDGWINTAPAHMLRLKSGDDYFVEKGLYTKIRVHCADLDISAAYPTNGEVLNISRETTSKELINLDSVSEEIRRQEGLNFSGGQTNAIGFMTNMFNAPTLFELNTLYRQHKSKI